MLLLVFAKFQFDTDTNKQRLQTFPTDVKAYKLSDRSDSCNNYIHSTWDCHNEYQLLPFAIRNTHRTQIRGDFQFCSNPSAGIFCRQALFKTIPSAINPKLLLSLLTSFLLRNSRNKAGQIILNLLSKIYTMHQPQLRLPHLCRP